VTESRGRVFGGLAALAVLWIVVYWWWEPRQPSITFDPSPPAAESDGLAVATWPSGNVQPLPASAGGQSSEPLRVMEPRPAVIPPQFREYTVRDGDTWESIARRELGSPAHAEAILRSNPLMSGDRPRAGRVVKIPLDPGNIQGRPSPEVAAAERPAAAGEGVVEYTIKSGDTLSGIAKAHYGSVTYADYIYTANRERLRSPDQLRLGDKLRLPPKPR
jgi:nucleoid-associated protein YgaU